MSDGVSIRSTYGARALGLYRKENADEVFDLVHRARCVFVRVAIPVVSLLDMQTSSKPLLFDICSVPVGRSFRNLELCCSMQDND
jgi:hypothetical protein